MARLKGMRALYAELPSPEPGARGQLSLAVEDGLGDWHTHGEFTQSDPIDLEAMGRQVMRAWISLARQALDRP